MCMPNSYSADFNAILVHLSSQLPIGKYLIFMKFYQLYIFMACYILSGCASVEVGSKIVDRDGIVSIETAVGVNSTYIISNQKKHFICASRGSDFGTAHSSGFSLGLSSMAGTQESIGEDSSTAIVGLGGVDPEVLLAREILYRTCEFMANMVTLDYLTSSMARELFEDSLVHIKQLSLQYGHSGGTKPVKESTSSKSPDTSIPQQQSNYPDEPNGQKGSTACYYSSDCSSGSCLNKGVAVPENGSVAGTCSN